MKFQHALSDFALDMASFSCSKRPLERLLHCVCEMYSEARQCSESRQQALRLGKAVAGQMCDSEAHGLVAWMYFQEARSFASTDVNGEQVPLSRQNRKVWNNQCTLQGMTYLLRALESQPPGPYCLKAAVEALHNQACSYESTDWAQVTSLYEALYQQLPTPHIAIERALAIGMRDTPEEGLSVLQGLSVHGAIRSLPGFKAARKELEKRMRVSAGMGTFAGPFKGARPQSAF